MSIHIFMDDSGDIAVFFAFQMGRHAAVAVNTVAPVVKWALYSIVRPKKTGYKAWEAA